MANKYDILWLDKIDSTNTEARKRISNIDNLSVLSALEQTAGRGQRGNVWHSVAGENLTFSIVLKFNNLNHKHLKAHNQFSISEAASLAVVDFLKNYGILAEIKWPNDIYVGNKKICGILIENSLKSDFISWSIIGIGINVNQLSFNAPNATSMSNLSRKRFDLKTLLNDFLVFFDYYQSDYLHIDGDLEKLRCLYLSNLWRIGEFAHLIDYTVCDKGHLESPINVATSANGASGRVFSGLIKGVSEIGMLIIEENGETKEYGFKEVGWIIEE